MPPPISDDERSDASTTSPPVKSEAKNKVKDEEKLEVESNKDEDEDEDDGEELGDDEYTVEAITNHSIDDETGELHFEVKWEGFEKRSDRTWEPEENLKDTADEVLSAYLAKFGGKEAILEAYREKKRAASEKKKRGRASTGAAENGAKRGKKSNGSAVPIATNVEFKPPSGNWEEEVIMIDACEGGEGNVVVFLTWKGGQKTQHPLAQVYKRCPQKMLQFYESHLVFKKNDDAA